MHTLQAKNSLGLLRQKFKQHEEQGEFFSWSVITFFRGALYFKSICCISRQYYAQKYSTNSRLNTTLFNLLNNKNVTHSNWNIIFRYWKPIKNLSQLNSYNSYKRISKNRNSTQENFFTNFELQASKNTQKIQASLAAIFLL